MGTLTVDEMAARYNISPYQVRERCRTRQWPHTKVGRRVTFTAAQVAQVDEMHAVAPTVKAAAASSWGRRGKTA